MKVLKFGGSSISTAENIKKVCNIILDDNYKIVILSAIKDITNLLSDFIKQSKAKNWILSEQLLSIINDNHLNIINSLFNSSNFKEIAIKKLNESIVSISGYVDRKITEKDESLILAQGELLSTMIVYLYLLEKGKDVALLSALKYIKLTKTKEPDYKFIENKLAAEIEKHKGCNIFITQGFIGLNHKNQITNLDRGGSDYTATIIGNVINAEIIEIWTDIDGLQNNDPRFVQNTSPIDSLSYEEASELAFFGAKVLHPLTLKPIQNKNIPLIIKNTFNPSFMGTLIHDSISNRNIKAVASKDGITTIKVRSGKMMQAYGYLSKIFGVFEKYQTSVDMLTTSEISVAMTIENKTNINEIVNELRLLGDVQLESNQSIICIVQNYTQNPNITIGEIIGCLKDVPVKMISYGSSNINCSLIIDTENKTKAMNLLNNYLQDKEICLASN